MEKDKKSPKQSGVVRAEESSHAPALDNLYHKLQSGIRRPKAAPDAMAAALEVVQRLAGQTDAEETVEDVSEELASDASSLVCRTCGYRNREGNRFCGMCGLPVDSEKAERSGPHSSEDVSQSRTMPLVSPHVEPMPDSNAAARGSGSQTHHFHHHYHHHYFPTGQEAVAPRHNTDLVREAEKLRSSPILRGESMSRAEAAVRRITQEWVLACNTKHLDDLLELYAADALVLRSNYPPVRGAAAIREFFFSALDAGLGEVELEPLRVEVAGDMAYEAGRCKALVPGAAGKRREERGKYLWVFARQSNGEWALASDCWSSDLSLIPAEAAPDSLAKPAPLRRGA